MFDINRFSDGIAGVDTACLARIGVVTDIHWDQQHGSELTWHNQLDVDGSLDRLREALAGFQASRCDAVVLLGDLTQRGDDGSLADVLATLEEEWGKNTVVVTGNHDVKASITPSCTWQPVPLISVELVELRGATYFSGVITSPTPSPPEARLRLVVSHFPLLSVKSQLERANFAYAADLSNRSELEEELAERDIPALVICGHLHSRATAIRHRVLQLSIGPLVEPPFESALVEVSLGADSTVRVTRHTVQHRPSDPRLRIPTLSPPNEQWVCGRSRWLPDVAPHADLSTKRSHQ
jgi:predicted phosphodiesterase